MLFREIEGHEAQKRQLRELVDQGRMPHALLLEGPSGTGKLALARALAQYIHCQDPQKASRGDACGRCPACQQHQTFNHIDMAFSFPVLKSVRSSGFADDYLDLWKEFLAKNPLADYGAWQEFMGKPDGQLVHYVEEAQAIMRRLTFTAHGSECKIELLWLPEKMNTECANKLLKLVEEPLPGSQLIFVSDTPQAILPTIYSRLQRVRIPRLTDAEVADWLVNTKKLKADEAAAVAHNAQGSLFAAAQEVSTARNRGKYLEMFATLMRAAYGRRVGVLKKWSIDAAALGREREMQFLAYCQRLLRENFILNLAIPALNYLNADEAAFCSRFAPFINHKNVQKLIDAFDAAQRDIAANGNAKIVLFDLAVRIILLLKT